MRLTYTFNVAWQVILDTLYLRDERNSFIYALDNVGKDFWLLIGKLHDYEAIRAELLKSYDVEERVLDADMTGLTELLVEKGFIAASGELAK